MLAQIGNCCTEQLCCVNDAVCCTIIDDIFVGMMLLLFVINGTIMVENNGTVGVGPTAALTVNGTAVGGFVVAR